MHKNNFNFLRLLGAMLVIFSHSFYITGLEDNEPVNLLTNQFEASAMGLCTFFFISGFFVTKSGLNASTIFAFIKNRVLRIFPALIVLVLITVFILGPIFTTLPIKEYFTKGETWKYLYTLTGFRIRMNLPGVFTDNTFHVHSVNVSLWSISLELYLYVSLIILLSITKNKKIFSYIVLIIILTCYSILSLYADFKYIIPANLTSIFFLGSFIAISALNKKQVFWLFVIIASVYILFRFITVPHFNAAFLLLPTLSLPIYLLGFSEKIKIRVNHDISYGMYIYAFPVAQIIYKISGHQLSSYSLFFLTILATTPIALASWLYIEKPFIRLKNSRKINSSL